MADQATKLKQDEIYTNRNRIDAARWTYKVVMLGNVVSPPSIEGQINDLAAVGWQVHTFGRDMILFRRDATGAQHVEDADDPTAKARAALVGALGTTQ